MKITNILIAVTVSIIFTGCATTQYSVTPVANTNSKTIYQGGQETLLSEKTNVVALSPNSATLESGKRQSFTVAIQNRTGRDIVFSDEDIKASYKGITGSPSLSLKVYSYDELVAEEKKRQAWMAVAAGLQAAGNSMSAASAGYSNTYGTYSGSTYSSYGNNYSTYGSYSATSYNYGAAQAAQNAATAQNDANFSRLAAEGKANLESLSATILKKQTVFTNQWFGGVIQIDMPRFEESGELKFEVKTGDETHEIEFEIEKDNKS